MIKEMAVSLSILIVGDAEEAHSYIGQELFGLLKKTCVVSTLEEAKGCLEKEKIDLIVVNVDHFGNEALGFIEELMKQTLNPKVIVTARQFNDASLAVKLVNLGVAGFIDKSLPIQDFFTMFIRVYHSIHDFAMMTHYVNDLEEQIMEALYIPCRKDCPRAPVLKRHLHEEPIIDETFEFFPAPQEVVSPVIADRSMYQDYFSYLMLDDKEELHDILSDMDVVLLSNYGEVTLNDTHQIELINDALMRFGNILMHYQFFSDTGMALIELGQMMKEHSASLATRSAEFEPLLGGFCSVLTTFIHEVWEQEAQDPKFFNDSIINDAKTICSLVAPGTVSSANDTTDDLFFF
jgi:hypothetical protein